MASILWIKSASPPHAFPLFSSPSTQGKPRSSFLRKIPRRSSSSPLYSWTRRSPSRKGSDRHEDVDFVKQITDMLSVQRKYQTTVVTINIFHFSKARSRTFALLPSTGCLRFSITRGASTLVVQRRGRPSARSVATAED